MPTITRDPDIERTGSTVIGGAAGEPRPDVWLPDESLGREDHLLINPGNLYTEPAPAFYLDMRRRVDAWFRARSPNACSSSSSRR